VSNRFIEGGYSFLNKAGEELCGDSVVFMRNPDQVTMVLSDGLGSGVKANILSTLTTRIISVMLRRGASMQEVTNTLRATLPQCKVRKIAYSTFSIAQSFLSGETYVTEYDNPPAFFICGGKVQHLDCQLRTFNDRTIKESHFVLNVGDYLVLVSDGEVHAGIVGVWNLGWDWEHIARYLEERSALDLTAQQLAQNLVDTANKLYEKKPGDDTTVGVLKVREKRFATLLIGAPLKKEDDPKLVTMLMNAPGKKIVCGGTTGNIVARELHQEIDVDMKTASSTIPPVGVIKGVDLVTEGTITILRAIELLKDSSKAGILRYEKDGANRLAYELCDADSIQVILGRAINPAHQNPDLPIDLGLKSRFVEELTHLLESRDKEVSITYH
jgi:hypothetical protein